MGDSLNKMILLERSGKYREVLRECADQLDKWESEMLFSEDIMSDTPDAFSRLQAKYFALETVARKCIFQLERIASGPPAWIGYPQRPEEECALYAHVKKQVPAVHATVYNGIVVIQAPHIPPRLDILSKHNLPESQRHFTWEITKELEQLAPSLPHEKGKRVCCIVSVYSRKYIEKHAVPDNDNLDIKYMIDTIAQGCGIDDHALGMSIFLETKVEDDIPEGTYFLLFNDSRSNISRYEVMDIIRESFPLAV